MLIKKIARNRSQFLEELRLVVQRPPLKYINCLLHNSCQKCSFRFCLLVLWVWREGVGGEYWGAQFCFIIVLLSAKGKGCCPTGCH